jgi:hypothetical protein
MTIPPTMICPRITKYAAMIFPATPNKVTEFGVNPTRLRNPAIGSSIHLNATRRTSVNVFFTLCLATGGFSIIILEKIPYFLKKKSTGLP